MKRIFVLIFLLIILCGCDDKKQIIENENIIKPIEEESKYIDLNPIKLGFYDDSWNLINSYDLKWNKKVDIAWPWVFPKNEETLPKESSKSLWQMYWNEYIGKGFKFGYEIKYTLVSGEEVSVTILKPSDNSKTFKYVELYIYDGLNETAAWFDHLEDEELTDKTVITSMKITGGASIDEVLSPISLKVFTYDGLDDFDELGNYRGISFATVLINKIE